MSGIRKYEKCHGGARAKHCIAMILSICLLLAALLVLSGCVFSDTITERIYDSNPESQIDYDLEPILINTPTATETTDKLPKIEEDKESEEEQDTEEDLPKLTEDESEATTQNAAPTPNYNENAAQNGAATSTPSTTPQQSEKAPASTETEASTDDGTWTSVDDANTQEPEEEPQENPEENPQPQEEDPEEEVVSEPEPEPDTGDDVIDEEPTDGPNEGDTGNGRKSSSSGDYYSEAPDMDDPEIPTGVDEVVAFGNNAVIVSILSGSESSSALLACDAQTQSSTAAVLAARGMGNVQALDYTEGEAISAGTFSALANTIVPDLVYVTEGANPFSDDQLATLAEKNISVYTLPALTSDVRIRFTFQIISQTLESGGVTGAQSRCNDYLNFVDGIIDKYMNANGGLTGGYDFEEERSVDSSASVIATLYIDDWDTRARYTNSKAGSLDSSSGAAVASLGYLLSPMNYYLSVGGVLNNAASTKVLKITNGGKALVWQFATGELEGTLNNWSSLSNSYIDLCSYASAGLFGDSLLCYSTDYHGLGTADFPALVAKDQRIAGLLANAAATPNGLYYAYGTITPAGHGSTIGYFPSGESGSGFYVESCIGRGTSGTSDIGEGGAYNIFVNPRGLCQPSSDSALCSWSKGSPESVLEASWAFWRFRSNDQTAFEQDVATFYSIFYGYTVSSADLASIEAGLAS